MASSASQHIDSVLAVASRPAATNDAAGIVHKSWARCVLEHGLDPSRPSPARILPAHEVREHRQQLDHYLRVARAGMEDLYRRVADLGYMVLLTDDQGITVDYIGNPAWEDRLRAAGLYLGADWNEAHAGTCGVGTCLVERQPMTCHLTEHFDATHIALTCTTAPLFDHAGKLVGVLDVSALQSPQGRESQHLARELVSMYARMIADADFLRHYRDRWILRLGHVFGLVDVTCDAMLAFDDGGRIVGANSGARLAFASASRWIGGLDGRAVTEILDMPMDAVWRIARGSVTIPVRGRLHHATLVAPRAKATAVRTPVDATPLRAATTPSADAAPLRRLAGDDAAMQALLAKAARLVDRGIHVLIDGETGSGKEVLARALHASGRRAAMPFVAVNCAAIPESLIESELFGYLPGSFTGGRSKGMKGLIAQADGGTLFLDEIGDMPLALQTRLLRVLAEGEVLPLGAERAERVDLSVIAATHRRLGGLVAGGAFREDLYYRLCGAALHLPPLRERTDLAHLVDVVLAEESAALGVSAALAPAARARLLAHAWPGNLRELRNAIRLGLAMCVDGLVQADDLALQPAPGADVRPAATPREPDDTLPAAQLVDALQRHRWRVAAAAGELGVCRATVYRGMRRHGIVAPRRHG